MVGRGTSVFAFLAYAPTGLLASGDMDYPPISHRTGKPSFLPLSALILTQRSRNQPWALPRKDRQRLVDDLPLSV